MHISRSELYRRVCEKPLSKLAPEWGVSSIGLAAICRTHSVPYPGSGYWTRLLLGKPVELPPLPEGADIEIEICPPAPRPEKTERAEGSKARKTRRPKETTRAPRPQRHALLYGVEEHLRKTREVKSGEFLRPYKRLLPDMISSEEALPKLLSLANSLFLGLQEEGWRVEIAPAGSNHHRKEVKEQEIQLKDRKYGQYYSSGIWGPDRPTIVHIEDVPIGIALIEMTERVTMRYVNGDYYREDSKLVQSLKAWRLPHTWTTEQDMPSGRFRIVAYSPKRGVNWTLSWQDDAKVSLTAIIPAIITALKNATGTLRRLMAEEDAAEARRKKEDDERWERYRREEDARRVGEALKSSQQQLREIIDKWSDAMAVEAFFADAERRLSTLDADQRRHLEDRLRKARSMLGTLDPLKFLESWTAPEERYRSKY